MSLEQRQTEIHTQQRKLLDFFQNKQTEWNNLVQTQIDRAQNAIDDIDHSHYLPRNLIADMAYTEFTELPDSQSYDDPTQLKKIPVHGFKVPYGRAELELISGFNFGFEGLFGHSGHRTFRDNNPTKVTDNPWNATPNKILATLDTSASPYNSKVVANITSKSDHISNRWAGLLTGNGHLLRVFCPKLSEGLSDSTWINLQNSLNTPLVLGAKYELSFYLYVKSGAISIGDHEGYQGRFSKNKHDAADFTAENNVKPWKLIKYTFNGSDRYIRSFYRTLCIGCDNTQDTEYFIALPYLAAINRNDIARVGD